MSELMNERGPSRRILFVTGRLGPTAAFRAILALARQLNKAGHTVEMVCRGGSLASVYPREGAWRYSEHNPPIWLSRALSSDLRGRLGLRGLVARIRKMNPEIIHVHGADLAGVGARLARRLRKPYVLGIGDFLDPGQSVGLSRRFIGKITVASDAVRVDLVNRIRLPRGAIEVVPEGVDMSVFRDRGRGRPAKSEVPVVGTVGRLVESKGHEYFIRAAHLLAMRGRTGHFVIAGKGPDRKRLQNLVSELDLVDRVTFARAPVDQLDVFRAMDVMVVAALAEALGLPAIEAMASRVPVIATSAGGVFKLIENGKTGILVPKKDPDAIARQMERLLDDPDTAAELAERGRAVVTENFNIERTAAHMGRIYEAVLADKAAQGKMAAARRAGASHPESTG